MRDVLVCSHRGPLVYERLEDHVVARRGDGGLVTALSALLREDADVTWLACALTDVDREVARSRTIAGGGGVRARLLDIPREVHTRFYDVACVTGLGFLFHGLVDQAHTPTYDAGSRIAWEAYREVNRAYALEAARLAGDRPVLVEDYHLMLVADAFREIAGPAPGPLAYFHHVPWCSPAYLALLPGEMRTEILVKLLAFDTIGFHARMWADRFLACCDAFLPGAHCREDAVAWRGRTVPIVVAPAQIDVPHVRAVAAGAGAERWRRQMARRLGGPRVVARVDRLDLWKNIRRGFLAFERLVLDEGRDDLAFLALIARSRMHIPVYRRYIAACLREARRVNRRLNPGGRGPIHVLVAGHSDHERALAVLSAAEVVLVNSTSDGLNLVAKESVAAAGGRARLVLSETTGVYEEIGRWTHGVNPFDIEDTASAMSRALRATAPPELQAAVDRNSPEDWLSRRLAAVVR